MSIIAHISTFIFTNLTIKKLKSIDIINVLSDLVSEKLETTVKLPIVYNAMSIKEIKAFLLANNL